MRKKVVSLLSRVGKPSGRKERLSSRYPSDLPGPTYPNWRELL
jgi:hypothetical protein